MADQPARGFEVFGQERYDVEVSRELRAFEVEVGDASEYD